MIRFKLSKNLKLKIIFLSFILLLSYHINLFGQLYFPSDSIQWITTHESNYCIGGSNIVYLWYEYLGADTLIQNISYHKLMFQPGCKYVNTGSHCTGFYSYENGSSYAVGGIRAENGIVIFQKFDVSDNLFSSYEQALAKIPALVDIVLYDFNWEVGDTVTMPLKNDIGIPFFVGRVVVENGLKRIGLWRLSGIPVSMNVIEGIGEKSGIFGMYYDPSGSYYLPLDNCVTHNGQLIQSGLSCNLCGLVNTHDPEKMTQTKIYPNPASDDIFIETESSDGPFVLRIFNTIGELIYLDKVFPGNTNVYTCSLDLGGLWHVVLTDQQGRMQVGNVLVSLK